MKKNQVSKPAIHSAFMALGNEVIASMGTPKRYIYHLQQAMYWVHEYEVRNTQRVDHKDPHFALGFLLEHTALPWLTSSSKDAAYEIGKGFYKVYNLFGDEGMHEATGSIIMAYGKDFENGMAPLEVAKEEMGFILLLYKIVDGLPDASDKDLMKAIVQQHAFIEDAA